MDDFTITVKIDLEKDARNYRSAFNKNTHSSKRKEQINTIMTINLEKLHGMKEAEAYPFLRAYLETLWSANTEKTKKKIEEMQTALDKCKELIFSRMETLTKQPLYLHDFTIFATSLNRGPYNHTLGYTRSCIDRPHVVKPFIHELLHFQTLYYYKEAIMEKLHDEKIFEDLKESLTFLLNYEFKDIIESNDLWYSQHQELRKQLETYRLYQPKAERDFEKLIDYGCNILMERKEK